MTRPLLLSTSLGLCLLSFYFTQTTTTSTIVSITLHNRRAQAPFLSRSGAHQQRRHSGLFKDSSSLSSWQEAPTLPSPHNHQPSLQLLHHLSHTLVLPSCVHAAPITFTLHFFRHHRALLTATRHLSFFRPRPFTLSYTRNFLYAHFRPIIILHCTTPAHSRR